MPNFSIDLAGIAALIAALFALYKSFRTQPREEQRLQADVAKTFADLASATAERCKDLDKEIVDLQYRLKEVHSKLEQMSEILSEWNAGIDLLLKQLASQGVKEPIWKPSKGSLIKIKPLMEGGETNG